MSLWARDVGNGRARKRLPIDHARPSCALNIIDRIEPVTDAVADRGTTPVGGLSIAAIANATGHSRRAVLHALHIATTTVDQHVARALDGDRPTAELVREALASLPPFTEVVMRLRTGLNNPDYVPTGTPAT